MPLKCLNDVLLHYTVYWDILFFNNHLFQLKNASLPQEVQNTEDSYQKQRVEELAKLGPVIAHIPTGDITIPLCK